MAAGGRVLTGPLADLRQAIRRLGGEEDPGWGRAAGGGLLVAGLAAVFVDI